MNATIAAALLAAALPGQVVEQPNGGSETTAERNESAGEELRRAVPVAATGGKAPAADDSANDQAAEDRDYAAEDLEAQQQMAFWTRIMGFSGLGALLLSLIGVWLIKRTFDETRRAAEAAHATVTSFKNAERGDLSVELRFGKASKTSDIVRYGLAVSNLGRSRVKITGVAAAALKEPVCPDNLEIRNHVEAWVDPGGKWSTERGFDGPQNTASFPYMGGYVRYRDRFGDEHRSHFCVNTREVNIDDGGKFVSRSGITHETYDCLRERDWPQDY